MASQGYSGAWSRRIITSVAFSRRLSCVMMYEETIDTARPHHLLGACVTSFMLLGMFGCERRKVIGIGTHSGPRLWSQMTSCLQIRPQLPKEDLLVKSRIVAEELREQAHHLADHATIYTYVKWSTCNPATSFTRHHPTPQSEAYLQSSGQ